MNTPPGSRLAWVDVLKFLGIWAVYFGHFGRAGGMLYGLVYTYHVPLFFFAAGFFSPRYRLEPVATFIKKKTLQLMLPYVFFGLFALAVFALQGAWGPGQIRDALLALSLGIRNQLFAGSLWFFPCLYIILLVDYFIFRLFKHPAAPVLLATILFVLYALFLPSSPSWFMNLDSACYYYFYFALGAALFPLLNRRPASNVGILAGALLALASLGTTFLLYRLGVLRLFDLAVAPLPSLAAYPLARPVFNAIVALLMIYLNVLLAKALSRIAVLQDFGRETLAFCGTEDVFKLMLSQLLLLLGITPALDTPLTLLLYALACLALSRVTLVRLLNVFLPRFIGKTRLA